MHGLQGDVDSTGEGTSRMDAAASGSSPQIRRRPYRKRMGVEMWQSQLRKGSLTLAVLASLWEGPLYGSEIRCRLEQVAGIVVSEGVIYPILRRLGKTHFVQTAWVAPEVGVPRRYFRLTSSGRMHAAELWSRWSEFTGGMHRMLALSRRTPPRDSPFDGTTLGLR